MYKFVTTPPPPQKKKKKNTDTQQQQQTRATLSVAAYARHIYFQIESAV